VLILERENRSSYLPAKLSNVTVGCFRVSEPAPEPSGEIPCRISRHGPNRILFFEHLRHELRLNLVQLFQRRLHCLPVFIRSCSENVSEVKGAAPHEQLSFF
jgi:hypothetical protein